MTVRIVPSEWRLLVRIIPARLLPAGVSFTAQTVIPKSIFDDLAYPLVEWPRIKDGPPYGGSAWAKEPISPFSMESDFAL